MRSPKRNSLVTRSQYHQYYAGYSDGFVQDMLSRIGICESDVILDPWNGSGTTTSSAATQGINAIGFDINPAAVLMARSRLLGAEVAGSLKPLAAEICQRASSSPPMHCPDLLGNWFGASTAREIRVIERAIDVLLVDHHESLKTPVYDRSLPQSSLASAFYIVLFNMVRQLVQQYVPSNPTWIKKPEGRRRGIRKLDLHEAFKAETTRLANSLLSEDPRLTDFPQPETKATISLAPSTSLPLGDESVQAILSSPPYCTRLDYVKATLPELAVMGLQEADIRLLRDAMIGTPTMTKQAIDSKEKWGSATNEFLESVTRHSSRESDTYYRKYYLQYFDGMWNSLTELKRVLAPGRTAVLVVQDSYYKEIHLDLPTLIGDMSTQVGWADWTRMDFRVPHTLGSIHPGSRRYREYVQPVESAVVLTKS